MNDSSRRIAIVGPQGVNWSPNPGQGLKLSVYDALVWSAILLSPFQDTVLQNTALKLPAASPSVLPLAALFMLAGARWLLRKSFLVSRTALIMAVYASVVCVANLVWVSHGEVVFNTKSLLTYPLLTALILFTVFGMEYRTSRGLRIAIYLAFFFTLVGILCGELLGPNAVPLLQATPSLTGRPSGFSTEASTLSVQIVASGMLTAHFLAMRWQKWFVGALTCALLVFSSSKGGFISLLLCTIVLGVARSRSSVLAKIAVAFVLLPLVCFGFLFILSVFGALIEVNQAGTIATRFSMAVYALITVAHNPFGVGFTGFLPSISRYLPQAMRFCDSIFPFPLWWGEVKEYLFPPQTNADCKTFFFDFLVFFGIPFAIVFFRFMGNLLTRLFRCKCYWLFVGVLFTLMGTVTYYSTLNAWTLPLLLGISLHEIKRVETSVRMH
ncbi:MAG: O-antigen ligase family protein [Terracidiphilus sp.]